MTKDKQAKTEPLVEDDVKIAMIKRGVKSQVELAKRIGKTQQAVNGAIKHGLFPNVQKLIIKELNL